MIVDTNGKVIVPNTVIPYKIRLHKSDDIYSTGKSVLIFSGSKGKVLNRYEIFPNWSLSYLSKWIEWNHFYYIFDISLENFKVIVIVGALTWFWMSFIIYYFAVFLLAFDHDVGVVEIPALGHIFNPLYMFLLGSKVEAKSSSRYQFLQRHSSWDLVEVDFLPFCFRLHKVRV